MTHGFQSLSARAAFLVAALPALLGACTLKSKNEKTVRIEVPSTPKTSALSANPFSLERFLANPEAGFDTSTKAGAFTGVPGSFADFDCLGLNVSAEDIAPDPRIKDYDPTRPPGRLGGLAPRTGGIVELLVSMGTARKVRLFGLRSRVGCDSIDKILDQLPAIGLPPGLDKPYILGEQTVDVFDDTNVSIALNYDPSSPQCLFGCGGGGEIAPAAAFKGLASGLDPTVETIVPSSSPPSSDDGATEIAGAAFSATELGGLRAFVQGPSNGVPAFSPATNIMHTTQGTSSAGGGNRAVIQLQWDVTSYDLQVNRYLLLDLQFTGGGIGSNGQFCGTSKARDAAYVNLFRGGLTPPAWRQGKGAASDGYFTSASFTETSAEAVITKADGRKYVIVNLESAYVSGQTAGCMSFVAVGGAILRLNNVPFPLEISPSKHLLAFPGGNPDFEIRGGKGPYSLSFASNGSGASPSSLTFREGSASLFSYTVGPNAGTADVIRVTDSLAASKPASVSIIAPPTLSIASDTSAPDAPARCYPLILSVATSPLEVHLSFQDSLGPPSGHGKFFSDSSCSVAMTNNAMTAAGISVATPGLQQTFSYLAPAIASGKDTLTVSGPAGSAATYDLSLPIPPALAFSSASHHVQTSGTLSLSATGGFAPYSFALESGIGTIQPASALYSAPASPGSAAVSVTDAAGTIARSTITVYQPLAISPTAKSLAVNNTFSFSASGGVSPVTFSASGGTIIPATGAYTAPATAGSVTVTATDAIGNTASANVSINAALAITPASGSLAVNAVQAFSAAGGVPPFAYSLVSGSGSLDPSTGAYTAPATVGSTTIRVTDSLGNTSASTLSIVAGPISSFTLAGIPGSLTAGSSQALVVTAKDASGNTVTGYSGTVSFNSDDTQAVLPAAYTFTAGDNGVKSFPITLKSAGSHGITVSDSGGFTASQSGITVNPAATTALVVAGIPASVTAGTAQTFTVTAKDSYGNITPNYLGSLTFGSTDSQALLPSNYAFVAADGGTKSFNVTLRSAGSYSVEASDGTLSGSQSGINVSPAAASSLVLSSLSNPVTAGVTQNITVTAKDTYGNTAIDFTGSVNFTSDDGQAVLPGAYTFTAGDSGAKTFNVTLKTAGSRMITAASTGLASATQSGITVNPAAATSLIFTGLPTSLTAGNVNNFSVAAQDSFGNTVTGYTGTISFTSSDAQAVLPADYTFIPADQGTKNFTVEFKTAATTSITASDGTITGSQDGIAVAPASQSTVTISTLANATAGANQTLAVAAVDLFGNIVPTFTGSVSFSSTDANALLPSSYTFAVGDLGLKTFNYTLKTAGSQTLIVTQGANVVSANITVAPAAPTKLFWKQMTPPNLTLLQCYPVEVISTDTYNNPSNVGSNIQIDFGNTGPGSVSWAYSDSGCSTLVGTLQIASGTNTTGVVYVKPMNAGTNTLVAQSAGTVLTQANMPQATIRGVKQLASGYYHTCALMDNGEVYCWGLNDLGQTGSTGSVCNSTNSCNFSPVKVTLPFPATKISAGGGGSITNDGHTCALLSNGSISCWGANASGQLGNSSTAQSTTPVVAWDPAVNGGTTASDIAVGDKHSCAVIGGTVYCWGDNTQKQVGQSSGTIYVSPTSTGFAAARVGAGSNHSCALTATTDGKVSCWGFNSNGQLGKGDNSPSNLSTPGTYVAGTNIANSGIIDISVGYDNSCYITSSKNVYCWGYNYSQQLGRTTGNCVGGGNPCSDTPLAVTTDGTTALTHIPQVSIGADHMCASASDGSSFFWGKCWGSNMYNQLGNSSLSSSNYYPSYWISPPTTTGEPMYGSANPLQHLMQVSAGRWYSCAIVKGSGSATSGAVACWGYSAYGQIGIGANYNGNTAQARFIPSFP